MDERIKEMLDKYPALDTDVKRMLFLFGVTADFAQRRPSQWDRNFSRDNLSELKLRRTTLKGAIKKVYVICKEEKVKHSEIQLLFEEIFELYLYNDVEWGMSVDEINYHISSGMTLGKKFQSNLLELLKSNKDALPCEIEKLVE